MPCRWSPWRPLAQHPAAAHPAELRQRLPLHDALARQVRAQRDAVRAVLDGDDPRLLVVVGPVPSTTPNPPWTTPAASPRWRRR